MEFEKIKEIIAEVLNVDVNEITMDTTFVDDLGAYSLDVYQIIMGIESEFDIEIDNDEAENIVSENFMNGIGSTINGASMQMRINLLRFKDVETLELANWAIKFVISIGKSEEMFVDILFVLSFYKALCEKTLGLNYEEAFDFLKEHSHHIAGYRDLSDGIRFYKDKDVVFSTETGDIKQELLKEISYLKNDKLAYAKANELYESVFKES